MASMAMPPTGEAASRFETIGCKKMAAVELRRL